MNHGFPGIQEFLDHALADRPRLRVLEAGCGSASHVSFRQPGTLVGIDISAQQLERNKELDERILGDLQTHRFPAAEFDVVICWDVLEHLPDPDSALTNMCAAVQPGGLVVLKSPNLYSVKGLVTKWSPHWIHVLAYRMLGRPVPRGRTDVAPFKTFLARGCTPPSIRRFARQKGWEIAYSQTYDITSVLGSGKRSINALYGVARTLSRWLSFGFLGESEYILVLRRPGAE